MSAGRLTDGTGNTVDFRHCCLILTSNLGNRSQGGHGDPQENWAHIIEAVQTALPVELRGRLDAIVPFRRLAMDDLERIVELKLSDLADRLSGRVVLGTDAPTRQWLAQRAWSPDYGAREVDRVLRAYVEPLLADALWGSGNESDPRQFRLTTRTDGRGIVLQEQPINAEQPRSDVQ